MKSYQRERCVDDASRKQELNQFLKEETEEGAVLVRGPINTAENL